MQERQDANLVFSDLVKKTVPINENLAHAGIALFGDDPAALTQSLERNSEIKRRMENSLCTDRRLLSDVSEDFV